MTSDLSTGEQQRRALVVTAGLDAFVRFGYRRATMADIAAAAGMSRPSLYLIFPGKAAVFRALAEWLLADAVVAAEAAWPADKSIADGLADAILAKDLAVHRLIASTSHAQEILTQADIIAGDLHRDMATRFADLVATRLAAAGDQDAITTARLVANAATGLKHAGLDEETYVADVCRLAALFAGSLPSTA